MIVRERSLPPGWYPATERETRNWIEGKLSRLNGTVTEARGGIVPHAGWEFSGRLALEVFNALDRDIETIVIVGGHLAPSDGIYAQFEDGFETPLGIIKSDKELLTELQKAIPIVEDRYADNCVEVELPFVKYLCPDALVVGMRAAPTGDSIRLGDVIYSTASSLGRKVAVIGSTDLTHYGLNYGFLPAGTGKDALRWVREVNDREFIELVLNFKAKEAIDHAIKNRSACSAGGAGAVIGFALGEGIKNSALLNYYTSYDIFPSESFVGYAGIIYY